MGRNVEDEIGQELRESRPVPTDDYVASIAGSVRGPRRLQSTGRPLAIAAVLSTVALGGLAATGGLAQATAAPQSVVKIVKKAFVSKPAESAQLTRVPNSAARNQYVDGEGCTPGYWKQSHHFDSWVGYAPGTLFSAVFENAFPGKTLLQVLRQGGGGLNALGRHTVAALLNASSPGVNFDLTTAGVIAAFNAVFPGGDYEAQKDTFAGLNEQGCPLN